MLRGSPSEKISKESWVPKNTYFEPPPLKIRLSMLVVKRDGRKEAVKFDKITARIIKMCYGLDPLVTPELVAIKVIEGIYDGVSTSD